MHLPLNHTSAGLRSTLTVAQLATSKENWDKMDICIMGVTTSVTHFIPIVREQTPSCRLLLRSMERLSRFSVLHLMGRRETRVISCFAQRLNSALLHQSHLHLRHLLPVMMS